MDNFLGIGEATVRRFAGIFLILINSLIFIIYFKKKKNKEEGAKVAIVDVLKLEGEKLASELN